MRTLTSWALVAAVALIALAAALDAVRAEGAEPTVSRVRIDAAGPSSLERPCAGALPAMFRGEGGTERCPRQRARIARIARV